MSCSSVPATSHEKDRVLDSLPRDRCRGKFKIDRGFLRAHARCVETGAKSDRGNESAELRRSWRIASRTFHKIANCMMIRNDAWESPLRVGTPLVTARSSSNYEQSRRWRMGGGSEEEGFLFLSGARGRHPLHHRGADYRYRRDVTCFSDACVPPSSIAPFTRPGEAGLASRRGRGGGRGRKRRPIIEIDGNEFAP